MWKIILNSINASDSFIDTIRSLSKKISEVYEIDHCSIFLKENDGEFTLSANSLNIIDTNYIKLDFRYDLIGKVLKREEPIYIKDVKDNKEDCILNILGGFRRKSLYAVPIIVKSEVVGIITLQTTSEKNILESTRTSLVTLSANIATKLLFAVEKKDIYKQIISQKKDDIISLKGKTLCTGATIGTVVLFHDINNISSIPDKKTQQDDELDIFQKAISKAKYSFINMKNTQVKGHFFNVQNDLADAYIQILESNSFYDAIVSEIESGIWIETAIKKIVLQLSKELNDTKNTYLMARSHDIFDIATRILEYIKHDQIVHKNFPLNTIIYAQEVTALMLSEVPKDRLKGIITVKGTANSHVAILSAALDIPCLTEIYLPDLDNINNKPIIIDGYSEKIFISANKLLFQQYNRLIDYQNKIKDKWISECKLEHKTLDNINIKLQANTALIAELSKAKKNGAKGIGLYRTEIPFMMKDSFPSEEEQTILYKQALSSFKNYDVTLRTLDVGADKPLPYLKINETNPAMGWRGIRMSLDQTNIFLIQIRAMMMANIQTKNLNVLLPMVSDIQEIKQAVSLIKQARKELISEGYYVDLPKIGVMLEVPSLLFLLSEIISYIDFISIGTNDLTQYLLAVDRNNEKISYLYNQLHPAMIKVYAYIANTLKNTNFPISICGQISANPLAIPLLIGLGYRVFSMNAVHLPKINWVIRRLKVSECEILAKKVITFKTSIEIKKYLINFFEKNDLASVIRMEYSS